MTMNKIEVVNDSIISQNIDNTIKLNVIEKNDFFNVTILEFTILKNTILEIDYQSNEKTKL